MPPFSVTDFLDLYPQFVGVFENAQIIDIYTYEALVNGSKVLACFKDTNYKYKWSFRVLAHILSVYQLGLTSRTLAATEGSVSATFEGTTSDQKEWWDSTPYGRACWSVIRQRGGATLFTARRAPPWGMSPWR